MNSESIGDDTFNEYRPLEPKHRTRKHYIIIILHIFAAAIISLAQFSMGLDKWFYGFGIITPTLLVMNGFLFSHLENDSWYREEMIPFISEIVTTTESETDRLRQYHRSVAWTMLVLGWFDILLCQFFWTYGLLTIAPNLSVDNLIMRIPGELIAWVVIFGPFFLFFVFLIPIALIIERIFLSRYSDIADLLELENKWIRESNRRAEEKKVNIRGGSSSGNLLTTNQDE